MPGKVPAPESALKRGSYKAAQTESFKAAIAAKKVAKKTLAKTAYVRAREYARGYKSAERKLVHLHRQAKSQGNFYLEAKPKVAIVTRIRGIAKVAPKQRKVLQLLRLRQIFNTVFVKLNKPVENMLRMVEPYIAYGYPSVKTIRAMVYKRGHLKVNGQRVKIGDNAQVQEKFAKLKGDGKESPVVCVEDIVNQIATCGPHFRAVTNGMWPYKMSPPKGGMNQKRRHFVEGGDYGNRDTLINKFIARMI